MTGVRRDTGMALAAMTALAVAAWVALVREPWQTGAAVDAPAFLVGWVVMMAAMMVPTETPFVLLHPASGRAALVAGYLAVWSAIGVVVYALHRVIDPMELPTAAIALTLAVAGVYQLTPLKNACLSRCRGPLDFLAQRWGRRPLRLGIERGAYCVGCCWGLMAVLVVAGAMALAWAAAIALAVFVEKVLPRGDAAARVGGVALLVGAAATAVMA